MIDWSSVNERGHCIDEVPSSLNSPSSLLTTLHKQQVMSKFITTNICYCCSGPSATKYFPFQNVIVNIHVLWLPTKRRTVHKKVSEPGLPRVYTPSGAILQWFPLREWNVWKKDGENGGAFGGFYHATDQNQVLSTKRTRHGTSHILQRKMEEQQVIQFSVNTKAS